MLHLLDEDTVNHIAHMCGPTMEGFITQLRLRAVTKLNVKITLPTYCFEDPTYHGELRIDKNFTDVLSTVELLWIYDIDHVRNPWQTISANTSHVVQPEPYSKQFYDPYSCKYLQRCRAFNVRSSTRSKLENFNANDILPPPKPLKLKVRSTKRNYPEYIELLSNALKCIARELPHNHRIESIVVDICRVNYPSHIMDCVGDIVRVANNLTALSISNFKYLRPILPHLQRLTLKHLEICHWYINDNYYDMLQLILFISRGTLKTLKFMLNFTNLDYKLNFQTLWILYGPLFWNSVRLSQHLTELAISWGICSAFTDPFITKCTHHVDRVLTNVYIEAQQESFRFKYRFNKYSLYPSSGLNEGKEMDIHEIQRTAADWAAAWLHQCD